LKSRIRIRIHLKSRIRIRIMSMRIRNAADLLGKDAASSLLRWILYRAQSLKIFFYPSQHHAATARPSRFGRLQNNGGVQNPA
jgi:hypothetical protein